MERRYKEPESWRDGKIERRRMKETQRRSDGMQIQRDEDEETENGAH